MSRIGYPTTRAVYLAVLPKDLASPLAPESDEEKDEASKDNDAGKKADPDGKVADTEKPAAEPAATVDAQPAADAAKKKEKPAAKVVIDFDRLGQHILALPLPERNYAGRTAGKDGIVYVMEGPQVGGGGEGPTKDALQRFDLKTRKTEKLRDGVEEFHLAAKGEKMLWKAEAKWFIGGTDKAPRAGEGALKLEAVEVAVDLRAAWRQMFREVWQIQRDFFYDPNDHGLNLAQLEKVYTPFLSGIASRADLNCLFAEMLGQLSIQHRYVAGGAKPDAKTVTVGLLGADYRVTEGRDQFARVFDGENWNPWPRRRSPSRGST
jgi:tricorn protease